MSTTIKIACAAAIALSIAGTAAATPIVLTFEGIADRAAVNDFYNGGSDSAGNRGVNYGINFSSLSLATIDAEAGGTGNFANEPSANTVVAFLQGSAVTMNVAAGFDTGFSFFYSSKENGFIDVYDGLNATGNLLASIELDDNIDACAGDPTGEYCRWTPIGVSFGGIAHSVDFRGATNNIGFDNITLGSFTPGRPSVPDIPDTPGNPDEPGTPTVPGNPDNPAEVPEPATLALMAMGLAGLARLTRRRRTPA